MHKGKSKFMFIFVILFSLVLLHTENCISLTQEEYEMEYTIDLNNVRDKLPVFYKSDRILSVFEGTTMLDQSPVYIIIGFTSNSISATIIPIEKELPELPSDQWYELYIRDERKDWYDLTGADFVDYPVISFEYNYDGTIPDNISAYLCVFSNDGEQYSYVIDSVMQTIPQT